jgi:hypothetical protein
MLLFLLRSNAGCGFMSPDPRTYEPKIFRAHEPKTSPKTLGPILRSEFGGVAAHRFPATPWISFKNPSDSLPFFPISTIFSHTYWRIKWLWPKAGILKIFFFFE